MSDKPKTLEEWLQREVSPEEVEEVSNKIQQAWSDFWIGKILGEDLTEKK